jgi:glycosyltransferase involved in cell wall biosynthesis
MSDEELFRFYNDGSLVSLISATRGEGYGLPMVEAAACGLPVIATNWSGHKTFLQDKSWIPVDYDLITIPNERVDGRIFMQNAMWAMPKETAFKNALGEMLKKRLYYKKQSGKSAGQIQKRFSHSEISKLYNEFLEELG